MDKVAIYARVSTVDKQDYDRQINDLTKIIKQHGYKDNQIDTYAEKLSGYKKERPELVKLISKAEEYKSIYVTEISRIGRNPSHTRQIIDELTEKGIPVYIDSIGQATIDKDGKRNAITSIILQVLMEFAHIEAEQTKSRMKSGKMEKVMKGKVSGANQAYGYKNVDGYLVIDEDESIVVQQIFEMYRKGQSSFQIANTLNRMEIPTRLNKSHADKEMKVRKSETLTREGKSVKWDNVTIRQILKNTSYIGQRKFKGEIAPAPIIIEEQLFLECNQLLSEKRNKIDVTYYTYLLKDLIYCGCCGKKYYAQYSPSPKDTKVYKCTSTIRAKGCGNQAINISLIESALFNEFSNSKTLLTILDNPNDLRKEVQKELENLESQYENSQVQKESKQKELSRLLDLYLDGTFSKELLENKQNVLTQEMEGIDLRIKGIKKSIFEKKQILSNYDEEQASTDLLINARTNRTELQAIYNQLIDKVIINSINKHYALITMYAKFKGIVIPQTLKLFINSGKVRYAGKNAEKIYRYIPTLSLTNEPEFDNNVLKTDIKLIVSSLHNMFEYMAINDENIGMIDNPDPLYKFETVPKENWLYINESDI